MKKPTIHITLSLTAVELEVLESAASNILDFPDAWDRYSPYEKAAIPRVQSKLNDALARVRHLRGLDKC